MTVNIKSVVALTKRSGMVVLVLGDDLHSSSEWGQSHVPPRVCGWVYVGGSLVCECVCQSVGMFVLATYDVKIAHTNVCQTVRAALSNTNANAIGWTGIKRKKPTDRDSDIKTTIVLTKRSDVPVLVVLGKDMHSKSEWGTESTLVCTSACMWCLGVCQWVCVGVGVVWLDFLRVYVYVGAFVCLCLIRGTIIC